MKKMFDMSDSIRNDITEFLERIEEEMIDTKQLGIAASQSEVIDFLKGHYLI